MNILIKNGFVTDPSQELNAVKDIYIKDGIIREVANEIIINADKIIDANGLSVIPGLIDMHVHFREPGYEYKETIKTGSEAAAKGGFTSVCVMPNTKPVVDSGEMVELINRISKETSLINIFPVGSITKGQIGDELSDIEDMFKAGAVALSEDGRSVMNAELFKEAALKCAELNIPILDHCEDRNLVDGGVLNKGTASEKLGYKGISNAVEDVIAARDIIIAKEAGCHIHLCHCSTYDSVDMVRLAREAGVRISAEVCPHHFTMTEDDITGDDADFKMNPPLRTEKDRRRLAQGICNGIMDVISTDHAPHSEEEKKKPIDKAPFGIVGIETSYAMTNTKLVITGGMSYYDMIRRMSTRPAEILGIKKGSLKPGYAADIVIADPKEKWIVEKYKFLSKGRNMPFEGMKLTGRVKMTICGGRIVYDEM